MYSTLSQKKNDLVIETAWNVTLFSRPVAAPPSDRKYCGVQPFRTIMDIQILFVAVRKHGFGFSSLTD